MEPLTPASELLRKARQMDREGNQGAALLAYRRVLSMDPLNLEAMADLAGLLLELGRFEEAIALCEQVLRKDPLQEAANLNLAGALYGSGLHPEAALQYRNILARDPGSFLAHMGLGKTLCRLEAYEEAQALLERAMALRPRSPEASATLMAILAHREAWEELKAVWGRALEQEFEGDQIRFERSELELLYGQMEEGWELYEARRCVPGLLRPTPPGPRWEGQPLEGRTLLLHWEQGLGDTLMALRYAALARARGARVLASVQGTLSALAATCPFVDQVVPPGAPLPPYDYHLPMMSLPRAFATRLDAIPAPIPYLSVPPDVPGRARLDALMAGAPAGRKVGLVWAGNPIHKRDAWRSLPTGALEPLGSVPGIAWFSLQVGMDGSLPFEGIVDLAPALADFSSTAHVLASLDLLITADTAVAHLAGAMGLPAWLMLPILPDWRWLLDRGDTPWYPSLRLFRQTAQGDWHQVVQSLREALS